MPDDVKYDSQSYVSGYETGKSIFQNDDRIYHRRGCSYDYLVAATGASVQGSRLVVKGRLLSGKSATLCMDALANNTFRLQFGEPSLSGGSDFIAELPQALKTVWLEDTGDGWSLHAGDLVVRIVREPFCVIIERNGKVVFQLEDEVLAGEPICPCLGFRHRESGGGEETGEPFIAWKMFSGDHFFGLGEKFSKVEKSFTRATIWAADTCGSNTTDLSYKSIPVLFSTRGYGIMLHSAYRSKWEIGNFSYTTAAVLAEDPGLDIFVFVGGNQKELLDKYTILTGRPQLPPRWAYGVWMSKCAFTSRQMVYDVLDRAAKEEFPIDVVSLDPPWMVKHYYRELDVDACDFRDSDERFPDMPGMFSELRDRGVNTCLWVNPYLPEGGMIYDEAKDKGFLVKSPDGTPSRLEFGNPVGIVDFTNSRATEWWKNQLRRKLREGAAVFKADYGDRVPEDGVFANGKTGREMHNYFMYLYTKVCFDVVEEMYGTGVVWRRSGYIGSQRYPGCWAGDTQVSWEGLRACYRGGLSAGLTGEAFWSHDIGGFCGPRPDPELFVRWAQFGLLSPFCRFHGTTTREPWEYGDEAMAIVRKYAQLRYSLVPYLELCGEAASLTGVPIMRHMILEFPNEPEVHALDDQYMLGSDILVAPVFESGVRERTVYLPKGEWYDFHNPDRALDGFRYVAAKAPLGDIPMFVRAGSAVPRYTHCPMHLKGPAPENIGVDVYPGWTSTTLSYRNGNDDIELRVKYGEVEASVDKTKGETSILVHVHGKVPTQFVVE